MNIQFSDYRRFVASLGLALIVLSFTLPWLVLKEPILVDVKQAELTEYTDLGRYNVYFRQGTELALSVLSCCFAPLLLITGVSLLMIGVPLWTLNEVMQERKEYKIYQNGKKEEKKELLKKQEAAESALLLSNQVQIKQKIDIIVKHSEISISRVIDAPASKVLEVIKDYKDKHAKMLAPFNYKSYTVEEGGFGAGTVLSLHMRVRGVGYVFMGKWKKFQVAVSEAEGMGFIQETMTKSGTGEVFWIKAYLVEPASEDRAARVTILAKIGTDEGIRGSFQRLNAEQLYTPLFKEELELLDKLVSA